MAFSALFVHFNRKRLVCVIRNCHKQASLQPKTERPHVEIADIKEKVSAKLRALKRVDTSAACIVFLHGAQITFVGSIFLYYILGDYVAEYRTAASTEK